MNSRADTLRLKQRLRVFVAVLNLLLVAFPVHGKEPVRIGILAHLGKETAVRMWTPTADYLTTRIPEQAFTVIPLSFDEINGAVERKEVDFVLTNPGIYVELEYTHGVTRIATLDTQWDGKEYTSFGGVIFTRADRADIRELRDLKDKAFIAVHETSFGGWRAALRELKAGGIDPWRNFSRLLFSGESKEDAVLAVRDGRADAGTVRTGILELMAEEGTIRLEDFKILNPQKVEGFPLLLSTRLYPEWAFGRLRHARDAIAKKVAAALLDMPADSPAAQAGEIAGFTVPLDYQPVQQLMKELRLGPFEYYGKLTLGQALKRYWPGILALVAINLFLGYATLYLLKLKKEIAERKKAGEALKESEHKFRQIAENIREVFWITDPGKNRMIYISPAYEAIWGRTCESLYSEPRNWLEAIHPDDRERVLGAAVTKQKTGTYDEQYRIVNPDGSVRWIRDRAFPVKDESGKVSRVTGVAEDITERKRAEEILRASLRLSEYALSHSLDDLLTKTLDEAEAMTGSTIGFFHFLEADQKTLWLQSWSTNTLKNMCTAEGKGTHYSLGEAGVWADAVRQRRPLIHNDYAGLPHRKGLPPGHAPVVREIVIPILRGELVVGILGVGNKPGEYDEKDVEIVSGLGNLAWDIVLAKRAEEELRKGEARYKILYENTPTMNFTLDASGKVLLLNRCAVETLGYQPEELVGKPVLDIFYEEDKPALLNQFNEVLQHPGRTYAWELRKVHKDGRIVWVSETALNTQDAMGNAIVLVVCQDITMRKHAEAQIRLLNDLVNQSDDGIFVVDPATGRFVNANDGACRLLHYSRDELLQLSITDIQTALRDASAWQAHVQQLQASDRMLLEFEARPKEGAIIPVEVNVRYVVVAGTSYIIAVVRDITERKLAEDEIKRVSREWSAAMDASEDVTCLLGLDRRVLRANKAFYLMTRSTPESATGKPVVELVHPEGEKVPCPVCQAQEEQRDLVLTMEADHTDNPAGRPIEITLRMVRDDEGRPISMLMTLHDLTHERTVQEELTKYREHLKELVKTRTAEIEEKSAQLERLNRAFVGRELRMIELKERIKELEKGRPPARESSTPAARQ